MCQSAFLSGPSLHHDKQDTAGIEAHWVLAVWPTSFFPKRYAVDGIRRKRRERALAYAERSSRDLIAAWEGHDEKMRIAKEKHEISG